MEELIIERRKVKAQKITALLNLSIADLSEEAELDKVDFDTLMDEIRVS